MARKQPPQEDGPAGAPDWMVTFSDCMTLLLTFFVLLLSFSSFDENSLKRLKSSLAAELPSFNSRQSTKSAFVEQPIPPEDHIDKGSEKPTLTKKINEGLKKETPSINFREQKVFSIPSDEIFWGNGSAISKQGKEILSDFASFVKHIPSRIVISENGKDKEYLGTQRAWAAIEYLTKKQGLGSDRFSISTRSMVSGDNKSGLSVGKAGRGFEIVLLERSTYN